MAEFFNMGGYGSYIWPAYGISALVIATLIIMVWRRSKNLRARLDDAEKKRAEK